VSQNFNNSILYRTKQAEYDACNNNERKRQLEMELEDFEEEKALNSLKQVKIITTFDLLKSYILQLN